MPYGEKLRATRGGHKLPRFQGTMQRIKVNSLIFSALLLCFVSVAPAFSAGTPRYDTAFIYMKPAELSRSLQQNAHNPAVLFQ